MSDDLKLAVTGLVARDVRLQDEFLEMLQTNLNAVVSPSTEVTVQDPKGPGLRRANDTMVQYFVHLVGIGQLDSVVDAAADGYDGVMIGCSEDPVLDKARTLVDIPVVGPAEATFHYACTLGDRFAIVTPNKPQFVRFWEKLVEYYNLDEFLTEVRPLDVSAIDTWLKGWEDPQFIADEIAKQGEICVENGADSIVIGSGGMSTMATHAGFSQMGPQVPVLDVMSCGLKMLETRVRLMESLGHPAISRAHRFERVADEDIERVRDGFKLDEYFEQFEF